MDIAQKIESLRPAFENLAKELAQPISNNRWDSLLSMNPEGSYAFTFIGRLVSNHSKRIKRAEPNRFYLENSDDLADYLASIKRGLGGRTLVVAEYLEQGNRINRVVKEIKKNKKDADVVALEILPTFALEFMSAERSRSKGYFGALTVPSIPETAERGDDEAFEAIVKIADELYDKYF